MIEVNNLTSFSVNEKFLKKIAEKALKGENKKEKDLSVALVGNERIKALNKKYLGKNKATDVLAFSGNGLGEILICVKEVKKNSKKFKSDFKKEIARVLIHGILHLLGYDHEKSKIEAEKMKKKEEYYFQLFF